MIRFLTRNRTPWIALLFLLSTVCLGSIFLNTTKSQATAPQTLESVMTTEDVSPDTSQKKGCCGAAASVDTAQATSCCGGTTTDENLTPKVVDTASTETQSTTGCGCGTR